MLSNIQAILDEYKISENVHSFQSIPKVIEYLSGCGVEYKFTEIEKDDMTGSHAIVAFIERKIISSELHMIEWECAMPTWEV